MALRAVERVEEEGPHRSTMRLSGLLDEITSLTMDALGGVDDDSGEADLVDQTAVLERVRGAVAALQAATMVRFARARVARELAEDVHPRDIGRGVAEEIGLACLVSPTLAARRLGSARAWWSDLPHTFAAFAAGRVGEQTAEAVVTEARHLDAATRRLVDAQLADAGLASLGVRDAAVLARRHAYEADREAYVARGRHERRHRRVGLRPAPDTMSVLSGYLPVEQGVACLAALRRHTDGVVAAGDERPRDQNMADTLVERLTGQARAADVAVEVQIIVPAELAADPETSRTATVTGAGPLPGTIAQELIEQSGRRSGGGSPHLAQWSGDRDRGVQAPVHGTAGRPGGRSGPGVSVPVLRGAGPPPRPRRAPRRRRQHDVDERPRAMRPAQPRPRAPRLARPRRPQRARSRASHRADHHTDRAQLHRPGTRPRSPERVGRTDVDMQAGLARFSG